MKDVATLVDIGDEEIDHVEKFVKTKALKHIIQMNNQINYFGVYFADNPDDFIFTLGERRQIKLASQYIKSTVDQRGYEGAANYFESNNDNQQKNAVCKCGSYAGVIESQPQHFLTRILDAARRNAPRKVQGYRYDDDIKLFVAYIRMMAGPLAYSTIQNNLKGILPSLSAVNKYIQQYDCRIVEGILRSKELLQYLKERNLPLVVSLSEDGTRITNRIQYDSKTNQLVGFVLPTSSDNGMPIPFSFRARNVREIIGHFNSQSPIGSNVNVVMAQPISDKRVPPLCLLLFTTDNAYTGADVENRWTFIIKELNEEGIQVLSCSSDSDPKYNSAMRRLSLLGVPSNYFQDCSWFQCGTKNISDISTFFVQDVPHILSKLRNFFIKSLKDPDIFPFGRKFFIRVHHLQYLVENFSKDKHNLTPSIINPVDKQNVEETVLRMCDTKVTDLLRSSVVDSQATIKFLEIMKNIHDSYSNSGLSPIERIDKIWYSVFILRIWRDYVNRSKKLKLKDNFLTVNCYSCIELNAHALVLIILQLQEKNTPEYFLPHLMSSQACESLFRQVRSFTSTFSTVVNCTVNEIVHRISKIQMQSDIMQKISNNFKFPRLGTSSDNANPPQVLPSAIEIQARIEKCKSNALQDAVHLGLLGKVQATKFDISCKLLPLNPRKNSSWQTIDEQVIEEEQVPEHTAWQCDSLNCLRGISLKNYAGDFDDEEIDESSIYVKVFSEPNRVVFKKSHLVWVLKKEYSRISSDRLIRVRSACYKLKHQPKKKLNKKHFLHPKY